MKKSDIPKDIQERIDNELLVDEQLLWVGLPSRQLKTNLAMNATLAGLVGFFILGIFAFMLVSQTTGEIWLTVSVLPIMLIVILAVFFTVWRTQNNVADLYAISDRRAMIFRKKSVQSFGSQDLHFIERKINRNGTGDIIFNREYYQRMTMAGTTPVQTRETETIGFFGIENPAEVEALMLETFRPKMEDEIEVDEAHIDYNDNVQKVQYSSI